jgi:hypothetical protein
MKVVTVIALLVVVASCRKEIPETVDLGFRYVPQTVGFYQDYEVFSVVHDHAVGIHDTSVFFLREKIESHFIDNEGRESMRLERYRKDSIDGEWTITDIWYATRTAYRSERIEEDVRKINLVFAVNVGKTWDGNALNDQEEREFEIVAEDQPYSLNGNPFDSTCVVVERDFRPGFYFHEYVTARYAKGVGLIERFQKEVQINLNDTLYVIIGTEWHQQLIGYGVD